jgi:hypothetical protein
MNIRESIKVLNGLKAGFEYEYYSKGKWLPFTLQHPACYLTDDTPIRKVPSAIGDDVQDIDLDEAIDIAEYWYGVTDCDCVSEHPTGGCAKCDMETLLKYLNNEKEE